MPRVCDIYAALPSMTGKLELEYEGELKGAEAVAQELVRSAVKQIFGRRLAGVDLQQIVDWFDLGGSLKLSETASAKETLEQLGAIQGLIEKAAALGVKRKDDPPLLASAVRIHSGRIARHSKNQPQRRARLLCPEKKRQEPYFDEKSGRTRKTFN